MQIIVYADVLFFINFFMDLFILYITGKVLRKEIKWLRISCGAGLSAMLYCFVAFTVSYSQALNFLMSSVLICAGVYISFRPSKINELIKLILTAHITAFVIGGAAVVLYYYFAAPGLFGKFSIISGFSFKILAAAVFVSYTILKFVTNCLQKSLLHKQVFRSFYIWMNGKRVEANGLIDTGNSLVEPISRSPVVVVEVSVLQNILPESIVALYKDKKENDPQAILEAFTESGLSGKLRLIPFSGADGQSGMMVGFKPEGIEICNAKALLTDVIIGICNFKLCDAGDYNALLHPVLVEK